MADIAVLMTQVYYTCIAKALNTPGVIVTSHMADKRACAHLRVRLPEEDKAFLGALSKKQGGRPNISRAVKHLIEKERSSASMVEIYPQTRAKIDRVAKMLRRTRSQVIDESFDSILDMIDNEKKVPLLVMELRLVRAYGKNSGNKANSR